jgi:peptidoglycan/LPS O-acetylase OafA/YrhL
VPTSEEQSQGQQSSTVARENRILNVARSLAALAVVLGHVRLLFFEDYSAASHDGLTALLYSLTSLGSQAVIVFFVLSGYWVGGSVVARFRSAQFSWASYGSARLTRLWLVLIPAVLLTVVVDKVGMSFFPDSDVYANTSMYEGLPSALSYSPLTVVGNLAFLQDLHVPVIGSNQPLWSLAFEFWYYLLFPALIALFWPGGRKIRRVLGLILVLLTALICGPTALILFPVWVFGAVVAAMKTQIVAFFATMPVNAFRSLRFAAPLFLLGVAVATHQVSLPFSLGSILLGFVTALAVAVFVTDVTWSGLPGRVLDTASRTSHASYSLYATHMPLVTIVAAAIAPSYVLRWAISPATFGLLLAIVAACCIFAYLFARLTERNTDKVRRVISGFRSREPRGLGRSAT